MSDTPEPPEKGQDWVPSAEQPAPPTTEFRAVSPEPEAEPDVVVDDSTAPPVVERPAVEVPEAEATVVSDAPGPVTATPGPPPADEAAPAWKTPAAAGLPPQWGDPDASQTGPQPSNQATTLWGLVPEDRPEVLLGVALAGGVLAAIVLRTLARR